MLILHRMHVRRCCCIHVCHIGRITVRFLLLQPAPGCACVSMYQKPAAMYWPQCACKSQRKDSEAWPDYARHDVGFLVVHSAVCNATTRSAQHAAREREKEFKLSIQPALAYEDTSMLESSAKVRMAAEQ